MGWDVWLTRSTISEKTEIDDMQSDFWARYVRPQVQMDPEVQETVYCLYSIKYKLLVYLFEITVITSKFTLEKLMCLPLLTRKQLHTQWPPRNSLPDLPSDRKTSRLRDGLSHSQFPSSVLPGWVWTSLSVFAKQFWSSYKLSGCQFLSKKWKEKSSY